MAYEIDIDTAAIYDAVNGAADDELVITALAIVADTKRETPVRGAYRSFRQGKPPIGGALRRSYTTARPDTEGDPAGGGDARANVVDGAILVGSWLPYSYYVDRGTTKMAARPHFYPAVVRNTAPALREKRYRDAFIARSGARYQ